MARIFPSQTLIKSSKQRTLCLASEDPSLRSALLFMLTTVAAVYSGQPEDRDSAVYFQYLAVRHLRQKLSQLSGGSLGCHGIFAVSLLVWVEASLRSSCAPSITNVGSSRSASSETSKAQAPTSEVSSRSLQGPLTLAGLPLRWSWTYWGLFVPIICVDEAHLNQQFLLVRGYDAP